MEMIVEALNETLRLGHGCSTASLAVVSADFPASCPCPVAWTVLSACQTRHSSSDWVHLGNEERQHLAEARRGSWKCYSKYRSIEILVGAAIMCFTVDVQVQKSFQNFLCYTTQKCSQTPRCSHMPRHTMNPKYPVLIFPWTTYVEFQKPSKATAAKTSCMALSAISLLSHKKVFSFSCTYRKKCLLCNNVLMIVAATIMGCSKISQSFEMILIGRFMCGLSAGEWLLQQVSRISQNFTSLFKVNNNLPLRKQKLSWSQWSFVRRFSIMLCNKEHDYY